MITVFSIYLATGFGYAARDFATKENLYALQESFGGKFNALAMLSALAVILVFGIRWPQFLHDDLKQLKHKETI